MKTAKIIPLNPTNLQHIRLFEEHKKEGYSTPIGCYKEEIHSPQISMDLLMEESSKLRDICHVEGYIDIKSCILSFLPKKSKKRKMISLAADYALNHLGMETVFIKIQSEDYLTIRYLDEIQFECLGVEKGSIIYLKEKPY